jgi:hypothetical protein
MFERGGNGVTRRAKLKGLKMMRGQCLKLRSSVMMTRLGFNNGNGWLR